MKERVFSQSQEYRTCFMQAKVAARKRGADQKEPLKYPYAKVDSIKESHVIDYR